MSVSVKDNFLEKTDFKLLQAYCKEDFNIHSVGEKDFLCLPTPDFLKEKLEIEGKNIVLTFIRKAYNDFDTDWRIHADNIVNGKKTSLASVLYIDIPDDFYTGTAFWNHISHGPKLKSNIDNAEFDRLILEDSNDLSKWKFDSVIGAVKNRLVTYNSNYFHSKYPNKIEKGGRIVLVTFYSEQK